MASWLRGSSSASRMRSGPCALTVLSTVAAGVFGAKPKGSTTRTVVPCPTVLAMVISPCIKSTSRRTMDSPSPAPWYLRVKELSTCRNGSKISSSLSSGMPIPVSVTVMTRRHRPSSTDPASPISRRTRPESVYLKELPTRLNKIWRTRASSPIKAPGKAGSTTQSRSRALSRAMARNKSRTESTSSMVLKRASKISILPDSIRDRSRISDRRRVNRSAEVIDHWTKRLWS